MNARQARQIRAGIEYAREVRSRSRLGPNMNRKPWLTRKAYWYTLDRPWVLKMSNYNTGGDE
jgi:hypothetical protein